MISPCIDAHCNGLEVCLECEYRFCELNPNHKGDDSDYDELV